MTFLHSLVLIDRSSIEPPRPLEPRKRANTRSSKRRQPLPHRVLRQRRNGVQPQLAHDVPPMHLDGRDRDAQPLGDARRAIPLGDQPEHFALPRPPGAAPVHARATPRRSTVDWSQARPQLLAAAHRLVVVLPCESWEREVGGHRKEVRARGGQKQSRRRNSPPFAAYKSTPIDRGQDRRAANGRELFEKWRSVRTIEKGTSFLCQIDLRSKDEK